MRAIATVFACLAILEIPFVHGQTNPPSPSISPARSIERLKVSVNVLVERTAREVAPLSPSDSPLSPSDLKVAEDGIPVAVESIDGPGKPISLCILIDLSASMANLGIQIRDASYFLAKSLPAGSEVMAVAFADKPTLVLPFSATSSVRPQTFENLQFGHRTALYDAIDLAESSFRQSARFSRRAMVIITDGGENASRHSAGETKRSILAPQGPLIYALWIHKALPPGPPEGFTFLRLVNARIVPVFSIKDILRFSSEISRSIGEQYALNYASSTARTDSRFHKLGVKLEPAHGELKIDFLRGYYIPPD